MDEGIVYKLTSPEGKSYIGVTTQPFEKRLKQHVTQEYCKLIHDALNKYGKENFKKEIILKINEKYLWHYEKIFIKVYNTLEPNGYNIREGGSSGSKHSEASKQRMREAKLGEKNHNYGKPRTEQARKNISDAKKGENHHFYGKKFTDEHKLRCAQAHRKHEEDKELPLYLVRIRAVPGRCSDGYAVVNHPTLKNKYFQKKSLSNEEKLTLAMQYLSTGEVHRPNGNGSLNEA